MNPLPDKMIGKLKVDISDVFWTGVMRTPGDWVFEVCRLCIDRHGSHEEVLQWREFQPELNFHPNIHGYKEFVEGCREVHSLPPSSQVIFNTKIIQSSLSYPAH